MGKIITFTNQKGGVGKTTTAVNVSAYLAAMGKKVLLVDIDPQGNATTGLGVEKKSLKKSLYDCLINECAPEDAIVRTTVPGLFMLPTNIDLVGAEVDLVRMKDREKVLRGILSRLRNTYDYITIDCPPSLGLLTINALTACDTACVPIQGEFFALEGLSQLMNTINLIRKHLNPGLQIEGVALTMYDARSNLAQKVAEEIHRFFGKKVFTTKIPRSIRLSEAPSYGLSIMQFDPRSTGALAYKALTVELLNRNHDVYTPIVRDSALRYRPKA
ncbi:MAG: AAA family ATPase [Clostridiales bacterium]|jgi:chromosome partitioning protein|nr:AAA family ATPase [Clostridiales bacterium]